MLTARQVFFFFSTLILEEKFNNVFNKAESTIFLLAAECLIKISLNIYQTLKDFM